LTTMARGARDDADGPEACADGSEDSSEVQDDDMGSTELAVPPSPPHELAFGLASEDDGFENDSEDDKD